MSTSRQHPDRLSRRAFVGGAAAALAGSPVLAQQAATPAAELLADVPPEDYRIENGRIKQSVYGWCFRPMPVDTLIEACHRMGIPAMDVGRSHYPKLKQRGMKLNMCSSHGFRTGPFSRDNRALCVEKLREGIDGAVECDCDKVITFTGYREPGISDEQGARNCIECWKEVIGYAEQKNVTLCLEILNTRDDSHPMKGHPGYFGDDVERCIDLIKQVDSPRMKLLFDVYHVQVMNGDVIRRIRQYKDYIGHYHVAGVPGRNEPGKDQEIYYPAVMRAILETGYAGYVTQEFIPSWKDKLAALRYAVRICDV